MENPPTGGGRGGGWAINFNIINKMG